MTLARKLGEALAGDDSRIWVFMVSGKALDPSFTSFKKNPAANDAIKAILRDEGIRTYQLDGSCDDGGYGFHIPADKITRNGVEKLGKALAAALRSKTDKDYIDNYGVVSVNSDTRYYDDGQDYLTYN